jgi:FKBP-type peptidyl-prolyl cis-trans isomerase
MKLTSRILCVFLLPVLALGCAAEPAPAAEASPETEDDKVLYALGLAVGQNLASLGLNDTELGMVQAGIRAVALGNEPAIDLQEYGPKIQGFAQARIAAAAETEKAAAAAFVAEQGAAEGATTTESGIVITELTPGTGESPTAASRVTVHYHGTLRDGTVFDSSVERDAPATFGLSQVIPCWGEALQGMKVGGKSRIVCPANLAYGDQGQGSIPPGAALIFEVELLEIVPEAPGS